MKFQGKWLLEDANQKFIDSCINATNNDEYYFKYFKINPDFIKVIGNDSREPKLASEWLSKIKNIELFDLLDKFKENDKLTVVPTYSFGKYGKLSTGTVYFIYILDKVIQRFGSLKDFDICEIGSGYGGQAKIFLDYGVKSYTCIDIEPVLNLAFKYLQKLDCHKVSFFDTNNIPNKKHDLVISNWCLSEMDDEGIKFYIDKVISKCDRGFFECNLWDQDRYESMLFKLQECFDNGEDKTEDVKTNKNGEYNSTIYCWKDSVSVNS